MFEPFILKALIAGIGIALMTGPLGCFIAWQRLAYFGDTIAHAALLGVVLALLGKFDISIGIIIVALAVTGVIIWLQTEKRLASDTVLGIAAHGALALGLVLLAASKSISIDVNGLLFGDILAVSDNDIGLIYTLAFMVIVLLILIWKNLIRLTLHADIARVEGVPTGNLRIILMVVIALTVAVSIKAVGILLVTSLLIIPAASMRYFSKTPTQMAVLASLAGMVSVTGGLYASLEFDTPSGPSIILAALGIFIGAYIVNTLSSRA